MAEGKSSQAQDCADKSQKDSTPVRQSGAGPHLPWLRRPRLSRKLPTSEEWFTLDLSFRTTTSRTAHRLQINSNHHVNCHKHLKKFLERILQIHTQWM